MKKLLTILALLLTVASQSRAAIVETTLWEDTYTDGVELDAATVATFKAGYVLRVYVTVPEAGANFKIVYKGAPDWSETTIPSIANQWLWVNGGETYRDFTLTADDITAFKGKNIYIYKGENSAITKVSQIITTYSFTKSAENGSITVSVGGSETEEATFDRGTELTLTASADAKYIFSQWKDGETVLEETNNTLVISLDSDKTITAVFDHHDEGDDEPSDMIVKTLSDTSTNFGNWDNTISIDKSNFANACAGDAIKLYISNAGSDSQIALKHANTSWDGITTALGSVDMGNVTKYVHVITSTSLANLQANDFKIQGKNCTIDKVELLMQKHTLTVETSGSGSVTVSKGGSETDVRSFEKGASLTFIATPETNAEFFKWQKNGSDLEETSATLTTTMDGADMTIKAVFKGVQTLKQATQVMSGEDIGTIVKVAASAFTNASVGEVITVNISDVSEGATITMKDNGNTGTSLLSDYSTSLSVGATTFTHTLTETTLGLVKEKGLYITGSGFTCGNITILSEGEITADAAHTTMYVLTVTQPAEGGTIQIGESNAVTKAYDSGTELSLTAVPSEGYKLAKWTKDSEDLTDATNPLSLTISSNTSITVTFRQVFTVTAQSSNETMGTVAITNAAEDDKYAQGSTITVTATPKNGYAFEKWTKTENTSWSSTTNPLSIEDLSANWTLTGTFTDAMFTAPEGETLLSNTATTIDNYAVDLHISTDTYNTYKVGDVIKVYVKSVADGAQVAIQNRNTWSAMNSETSLATDATVFSWTVTGAENVANMNSSGLKITGQNYTAWGVTIIPLPTGVKNLSTGSKKINGSTSVTIPKTMFANAVAGDVITVNVSSVQSEAKYTLKGWSQDEREGDNNKNWSSFAYEQDLATDATSFTCILTADILNIIQYAGLSIEGGTYTCDNVTLTTAYDVPDAQTHSNPAYTLTVTDPVGGTIAIKNGSTPVSAGSFELDTELTLTATANGGYVFNKWTKDGTALEDTSNPLTITMTADVTMAAIFKGTPLVNEDRRTLWESANADGDALNWEWSTGAAMMPSAISDILEVGEQLIFTVKVTGDSPSIRVDKLAGGEVANTGLSLVDGENRLSLTAAMITEMADGFKLNGQGASITKLELYKPTPITALAEEDAKTLWSNTSGEALAEWNTITIDRNSEWGAVLEEDERIIISVKAKDANCEWPTVALSNSDGSINSTSNLLNDLTMPTELTITLTAEMVNKMKNGFNITGDGATITKVVLYKPTVPTKTVHTLNSTETAISGDANVTVAAAKFANISAYDVLTVNFTITASPANVILKGNGEDGGWDYLKEMKFENGETLFALPLTPAMTSNLKKNGLQITGSDYKCKSVTIKTAGEVPSDGEDDISNDASEEAKKVYNVLKDLYGKKIVSGVVANVDWNTKEAENVYGWTGKYPALNVYDFINLHASKDVNSEGWLNYSDITTAKNWWKEGGIVGAMWHWQVKANNDTDYTCTPGTKPGETSFDASQVYVDGTPENKLAKQQLDQLCGYLKKMQDAGIPVVWRPLHEASGNVEQHSGGKAWFWWGAKGADVYKQLWQWMYKYMVTTKGLNNLIWVWTSQTNDNNWYPGDAYVDIIGRDNYGATAATLATEYEALKDTYPNKMITLSECGNSETAEMAKLSSIWDAGSRWSWFMTWYDGAYNDGTSSTHKHAGETWWKDAVSKDYVITRDKMKELLGQESSDDSKTGVNISLDDLNEGWSSTYDATTKTITTEGEWAARGWYIGDNRYNSKGSITVKYEAVQFGVTLKMEYTNTNGDSKSVSAGAAAGETEVELDIPTDVKTIEKVYITYQPIGTLKLTAATVNDKVVDNRTEKTLVEKSQAIADGDIAINRGLFSNAVAGDEIRIYADNLSESSKLALEPGDYSGALDGANWTAFTESPFKLKLTATVIATIQEKGLLVRGESFTFKKAVLYTEKDLGSEISDEEKKDDEKKDDDDEETIIDEETGEADLTVLSAQDDTKTTLTENEDGSITMTTTEPYCAAQIWFNDPKPVAGNVLKVELAESNVNVTVTVKYTDGTESQMSANTMVANARAMTRAVASARAATRGDSDSGTTVEVPLETGKEVQNIEVKNNVAGTITIKKMQVTTINVFTDGVANLSMLKPQSNATYDTSTHTLATTKGWTGATISPVGGENVSGKELLIEFADASKVKVAVKYRTDVEGPSTIMEKAAKAVRLALDNTKNIQEISIQPTEASIVTFKKIAVNSEESDDGSLKPGRTITLWENAAGKTLAWNEVANQDASVGEILQEYDELLITISGVTEGCDWPKVFIRDASSEQAGNEVLLNDIGSFPYTVRIVLTGEMAQQLQKGFSICGDGVTVTKLQVYRPEAPKTGDIHLADLNYGYNSSYDKGTHTITTTARWAARGWEIGDKRYNDKNLITVKFEAVDFPVTLKMEYTTGVQTAQATSVGVPAGRTELLLEIPKGISKLNRVYIIYENPGSVKLTEVSVTYQDNLKLSTAIKAFEADGVIRDGRYDTDGWYNLRGQRIPEPKTSGVYIHGGKKVVIY